MKYLSLIIGLTFIHSQLLKAQLIQFSAGVAFSRNTAEDGYETAAGNLLAGYRVGFTADLPVGRKLSIVPGLFLTQWGSGFARTATIQDANPYNGHDPRLRLQYFQLPVLLTSRFVLSPAIGYMLGFGPYFAYRVNEPSEVLVVGRANNHVDASLTPADNGSVSNYRRTDFGLSLSNGIEIQRLFNISLHFDYGLQNIMKPGNGVRLRNEAFSVSVGHYINRKAFFRNRTPF